MIRLEPATVLLQWAVGGLLFLWVTSRRREVGIGYGWLLRSVYASLAAGALVAGLALDTVPAREAASALVVIASLTALAVSVVRRRAGVALEHEVRDARRARVAAMAGEVGPSDAPSPKRSEFPPLLDLAAPVLGAAGLIAAGVAAGGPDVLAVARTLVGAAFLGAVSDAMLLGHWYLVQPGLGRAPLHDLTGWVLRLWPVEVAVLLWPTGMVSVLTGSVDDGWQGTLGWFWVACAAATGILGFMTRAALRERAYSAVMAATGLLYLAILTAFGTDLVARAVLAP